MKLIIATMAALLVSQVQAGTNTVTANIESSLYAVAVQLQGIKNEAADITKAYFSTGASTLVGALASDTTAATVASKLTKGEFINGIVMSQQLENFFGNSAVSQSDYMSSAQNLVNGSDAAGSALSQDVESIGSRLASLSGTLIEVKKKCQDIIDSYNGSELSAAAGAMSASAVVFGSSMTKQRLGDGINLCQEFNDLMGNAAVAQGDWKAIVAKFVNGS